MNKKCASLWFQNILINRTKNLENKSFDEVGFPQMSWA